MLALLLAGACAFGIYVSGTDTIFPNVTVDGVYLGGLTKEEAGEKLEELGWDKNAGKDSVTMLLPLNKSITVKAKDVNGFVTAEKAVDAAFEYGHGESFLTAGLKYLKSAVSGAAAELVPELDEAEVARLVTQSVTSIKAELMGSGYDIDEEESLLMVVKGAKSVELDESEITALFTAALYKRDYADISYDMDVEAGEELNIDELYESVHAEKADAYYDKTAKEVVASVTGYDFDKDEAKRLWEAAQYGETVSIPLKIEEPELSTEELESHILGDVLATTTTTLRGSTQNRIDNVTLACEKLNGTILEPGEVFSYNEALGQRTEEAGFKYAGAYSEGQVVQEIGGGICQVSSMVYYCQLYANLKTVDRTCHYFPVAYLNAGFDATVSWKRPDYKFENTSDYPIRIDASVNAEDKSVTMSFMGTNLTGEYVKMTFVSWAVYANEEYPDISTGFKVATYRWIYDKDDILITKGIEAYSEYHYHEEDIEFPESPSPSPEPSAPVIAPPEETAVIETPAPEETIAPAPTDAVQ